MKQPFYKLFKIIAKRKDLTYADKVVFSIIAGRIGKNGHCWAGIRKLTTDAGGDKSTVKRSIDRLEKIGLLQVERRGIGKANHYRLPGESLPESVRKKRTVTGTKAYAKSVQLDDKSVRKKRTVRRQKRTVTGTKAYAKSVRKRTQKAYIIDNIDHKSKSTHTQTKEKKRFVKPTPEEITDYARSIDFDLDGAAFVDHYEANGWTVGRNKPMRDWKATVRTWKRNRGKWDTEKQAAKPTDSMADFFNRPGP